MPSQSITLTSASTNTSTAVALNWLTGGPTTVSVIGASNSSGAFNIQYTLNDILTTPASLVAWSGVSSGTGSFLGQIFNASNATPDGVTVSFLNPIAAVRLASTATNNVNNGPLTMRVLQGD